MDKQCSRCKELKAFSDFFKDKSKKDGHQYACKVCMNNKERMKEKYLKHREKNLAYAKKKYYEDIELSRLKGRLDYKRKKEKINILESTFKG